MFLPLLQPQGVADVLNVMNNTRSFGRTTCVWYSQRSLFE
jgi:hypothetical protein